MPTSFLPPSPLSVEYDDPFLRVRVSLPRLTFDRRTVEVLGFPFSIVDPFSLGLEFQDRFAAARLPIPESPPSLGGVIDTIRDDVIRPRIREVRRELADATNRLQAEVSDVRQRVDGITDQVDRRVDTALDTAQRRLDRLDERVDSTTARLDQRLSEARTTLRQRIDDQVDSLRAEVTDVTETVDRRIDEATESVRQEVFDQLPSGLIADPVRWSFSTTIGHIEAEVGNGITDQIAAVIELLVEEALSDETRQRLQERADE